jgi:predicted DCC family thiol-disulfide oxidoreductase YuxK
MILKNIPEGKGLIVFDGLCVLCSSTVSFLTRIDKKKKFLFTTFDSQTWRNLPVMLSPETDSIILLMDSKVYIQSEAIIRIIKELIFPYSLLRIFTFIPFVIRERVYRFIAKHRYTVFGKKDSCGIPEESVAERYLK